MLIATLIIVLGFVGLIWGADRFVTGASSLARNYGISPLIIGLTIVAFGTSAPEFFSSAVAAYQGKPGLAIGNAFGSNLFNIGIALAIAAIISPLELPKSIISREIPALLLVTTTTAILLLDLYIGTFDAIALLLVTAFLIYKLLKQKLFNVDNLSISLNEDTALSTKKIGTARAIIYLAIGLFILLASAEALVQAASNIADHLGVSAAIIGLTIVALGTSLPELAAAVVSVMRGHDDLAIGNIFGSNILNFLVVLPFPGLLAPGAIEPSLFYRDFSTVLLLTALLCFICYRCYRRKQQIGRLYGVIFLLIYCSWFTFMMLEVRG
jgi:cation:H+ antiporter